MNANTISMLDRISGSISIVGSMNADYTVTAKRLPKPGETIAGGPLRILPGGKSGNQAAAAARIGASVSMFGAVGSDANADFLLGKLNDAGVDTTHVRRADGASGTTVITVDDNGENTIVYSAGSNATVSVDYIESRKDVLLKSSVLGLCLESPIETVTATAKMCHDAGIKVLLNDSPFTDKLPNELIAYSDILLVNEHEMAQLLNIAEPKNDDWLGMDWNYIAHVMHDFGFKQAVVTLGADGAIIIEKDHTYHVDAAKINAVDTTGCGDAFMGTLLAGLSSGFSLSDSASLASYVAAYAATGYGAQASYGSAKQIKDFFTCPTQQNA
ncbi:ribokinase [Bifidobacterium sp. ESL0745]|uniref:ribokinase n=1 Tax=Bifidobacterium sp. ESL0745 TaxID=2983226 RepID=UPI0023F85E90|nr:ribokinase [Bifidobacterium sp. ESL0745]MDF7665774.1 ribokinase [Bifidobacterium sp. ESL0745]